MDDKTIVITKEDGQEITCDILFTYHSDQFGKDYVVFQPRGVEELSAACYIETGNGEGKMEAVQTEEEWSMLEELVNDYYNEMEGCSGSCKDCSGCGDECDCDGTCGD